MTWTTSDLIAAVRVRAQVPDDGGDPTDSEILRIATEEHVSRFVGIIRSTRENYLVTSADTSITSGTAAYALPRDAHGDSLRDIWLIDSSGRSSKLRQLSLSDGVYFGGDSGKPAGFYVQGRHVVMVPTPSDALTGYSLRMFYYRSPSVLVPVASCYPVASKTSTTVTVTGTPSWTSGTPIDIVQAQRPFDVVTDDNAATRTGSVFTLASSAPTTDVSAGDYVCNHMETCVPQIPDALWPAFVSAIAVQIRLHEADPPGAAALAAQREEYIEAALKALQPRVDGKRKAIVNLGSVLRRGRSFR